MKRLLLLFFLFVSVPLAFAKGSFTSFTGKVLGISGGDTIRVMHEGKPVK